VNEQKPDISRASSLFWGFIGLCAGNLLFVFVFYLFLQEDGSLAQFLKDDLYLTLVILAVNIYFSIFGAYYFQKNNREIKRFDIKNPDLSKPFLIKFSFTMLGFFGSCFLAWLGLTLYGYGTPLTIEDYSLMGFLGFIGASTLWEEVVLREFSGFFGLRKYFKKI